MSYNYNNIYNYVGTTSIIYVKNQLCIIGLEYLGNIYFKLKELL